MCNVLKIESFIPKKKYLENYVNLTTTATKTDDSRYRQAHIHKDR